MPHTKVRKNKCSDIIYSKLINLIIYNHFKLKSTDEELEEDKKLDFDIWLDSKKNIIIKVEYNRLGKWQYILKNVE